ncbi:conserved hypothetical protein [Verticillium alfalfae VaMs.102]|uniref:Uncharacterized protein n=1 Tax=Verticillium alfalfae (strain VaMs.102 / ATCC MYA-4576 / FGSC 10136) TaxID=526221 RepID=C9SDJ2_VERA1|nr:conserved hypothetical protein [Verticillium alfalfae VaMs.102]EEY16413.1 conserved hypothetical protein [Verticillium alfalfae VaMs.102]
MVSLCTRYLSLDQAGLVDELVASRELATVEAIGEAELRAAVQELDCSTTIINKQTEMLRQHHNALAKLADSNAKSTESRREMEATRTTHRVIKYTVEMTRTKLDRTYLEALESAPRSEHTDAPASEVKALQEELESLYAEILPVAQMSVEQQYLEPALKSLSEKNGQSVGRSMAAISYSYQAAAATLVDTAKMELAVPAVAVAPKKAHPVQPASPPRARVTTSTPGPRRRRSSGTFNVEPPIEALLRLLTINLATSSADPSDGPTLLETLRVLSRAREGRAAKAYDVTRNAQESFEHFGCDAPHRRPTRSAAAFETAFLLRLSFEERSESSLTLKSNAS